MLRIFQGISILLAGALVVSCVSRGKNFSTDVSWIKLEETTKTDIQKVLGEPFAVGQSSYSKTWTYGFYEFSFFGKGTSKELKVYWGDDGTVKSFSLNSSFPEDKARELGQSK